MVSERIVWASGAQGTVLRTSDGGEHWEGRKVDGADALDFRDVVAFDANTALIMSSGTGDASRLYFTADGGEHWKMVLSNPDKSGFFDAVKFWNRKDGMLLGDPVNGRFSIFVTSDGGMTWARANEPAAFKAEGAFAASGTCLALSGKQEAWFGSGGPGGGRVFHSRDSGRSWRVANTPMGGDIASAGIFGLKFLDHENGIAVGGDYRQPGSSTRTVAITRDGGETWTAPAWTAPAWPARTEAPAAGVGFRSGVVYLKHEKTLVAVGTGGSSYSMDRGLHWQTISNANLNAVASARDQVWAVGPRGLIVRLTRD